MFILEHGNVKNFYVSQLLTLTADSLPYVITFIIVSNSFSTSDIKGKFSMSWLYDVLADEWSDWLPADALKTLRM